MSVVTTATLGGYVFDAIRDVVVREGAVRRLPCGLDTAALEHAAEAETDDTDVDPHDRGWHDGGVPNPAHLHHAYGRRPVTRRTGAVQRWNSTPSPIRGPPARC